MRAGIAVASGSANYYEREATSSQAMEHDKQAEEDHEEVEEDEEEDEEEQDTLFKVPPGVGDKSDSDGLVTNQIQPRTIATQIPRCHLWIVTFSPSYQPLHQHHQKVSLETI